MPCCSRLRSSWHDWGKMTERFTEAVRWLEDVPRYGHKDGLNNMLRIMERLGHPERSLQVIHVAGTNGKGSCCAMLQQILMESGYRVGMFISPHLVDYRERIRIDQTYIDPDRFVDVLDQIRAVNDALVEEGFPHATFFEFLTATALLYFSQEQPDLCILETGVGGRLDATNIIERPQCCLITSISLDHTRVLGDTLELIAGEKAGIMKPGVPVVVAQEPDNVLDVLRAKAEEKGSPFHEAARLKFLERDGQGYQLSLQGAYQFDNAEAVLETVRVLREQGWVIPEGAVTSGLKHTDWPGRMQTISIGAATLLLDGAHNPGAAERLGQWICSQEKPVQVLLGVLSKKDAEGVLEGLLQGKDYITRILCTPIPGADSLGAQTLEKMIRHQVPCIPFADLKAAVDAAARTPGTTIICGSLYLIGAVLEYIELLKRS